MSTTERKGIDMSEYDEVSDTSYDAYLEGVAHTQEQKALTELEQGMDNIAQQGITLGKVQVANIAMGHLVDIMAVTNESLGAPPRSGLLVASGVLFCVWQLGGPPKIEYEVPYTQCNCWVDKFIC